MYKRKDPKVSIIIPSWFTTEQHGKYGKHETFWFAVNCLRKLIERTPREDYELIIIDNGSTLNDKNITDELEELKQYSFPSEYWATADILIRNKENLGFGPACNQGFALARGEYVCCLNNDVLVWTGWLEAMLEPFNLPFDTPVGVSMPALMKQTRDAREALDLENIDLTTNNDKYGIGAEFGSLWVAPMELLQRLVKRDGYVFDEHFKLGMSEDRDLWDRMRTLGHETCRTHKTRVFHQGNLTIGKVPDRKKYTERNREYLSEKRKLREQKI